MSKFADVAPKPQPINFEEFDYTYGEKTGKALRAKAPGGWIVWFTRGGVNDNFLFIPDANHQWVLNEEDAKLPPLTEEQKAKGRL